MTLSPGLRLGPYEILGSLGTGGMGEVYRATDTNLKRQVAIKVLPASVAADAERLARFQREAEVLAALNHPHIAAIYGLEKSGGTIALVMELVEGPTLADVIAGAGLSASGRPSDEARGERSGHGLKTRAQSLERSRGLPVEEALAIAKQIAEALEAAHDLGIVHRDLKPANVKVREDGTVKVLDFGLAKAMEPIGALAAGASQAPTITTPAMTQLGVILGTAAYMSPEQARGRAVDRRTDIWAFGCVLYEMLTGRRAFGGEDLTETLAAVVKSEPDWEVLPRGLPPTARLFLRRCLHKDPRQRVGDIRDVRLALEGAFETKEQTGTERRQRGRHALSAPLVLAGVAASAMLGAIGTVLFRAPAPEAPEARLQVETLPGAADTSWSISFAISPDGRAIVFEGSAEGERPKLWLRSLDTDQIRPLPGTEGGSFPFWSPDSRSIAFRVAGEGLKRLDLESQVTRTVSSGQAATGTWSPDSSIVFSPSVTTPLFRVPAAGGQPVEVTRVEAPQTGHRFPQFLPDGRHFVFFVTGTPEVRGVYVGALGSTESRRLFDADSRPEFLPPDYLVFSRQDALLAQRLDLETVTAIGEPFVVGPMTASQPGFIASMAMSASRTGAFVYRPAAVEFRQLTWFDRSGRPVNSIGEPDAQETGSLVTLSPDGSTVAKSRLVNGNRDIWLIETARGVMRRLTSDPGIDREPVWSPDGTRIAFSSVRKGLGDLYQTSATGAARDEALFESPINKNTLDWSPDGQFILYAVQDPVTRRDLWALPLTGDRKPMVLVQSAAEENDARFSPDGRWIVYESDETGQPEVFVTSFPRPTGATQISSAGGTRPQWRQDGREIFYSAPDGRLTSVAVTLRPEGGVDLGPPAPLFAIQPGATVVATPDGQRFLIDTPAGEARSTLLNVVLNWKPPAP